VRDPARLPSVWSFILSSRGWWRWLAGFGLTVGLLIGAPPLSEALDARGLPGGPIALGVVVAAAALTLWAFSTTIPRRRRRRAMTRWARERAAPFRSDFTLPLSLSEIPSLAGLQTEGGVANLVVVRRADDEVLVFDRWRAEAAGYEDAEWRTVAAVRTTLDAPLVVVHPRRHGLRIAEIEGALMPVGTESIEFDHRYRILAEDRAAAVAVVDARTMAWLLDRRVDLAYESAGSWVACSRPSASGDELDALIDTVLGFRDRLPRVLGSFFPRPDPGFDRIRDTGL
jgi:hypothetical protein